MGTSSNGHANGHGKAKNIPSQ
ncbi:hypothetical protein LCGC14_2835240, partial [marine sediment metagenome]